MHSASRIPYQDASPKHIEDQVFLWRHLHQHLLQLRVVVVWSDTDLINRAPKRFTT